MVAIFPRIFFWAAVKIDLKFLSQGIRNPTSDKICTIFYKILMEIRKTKYKMHTCEPLLLVMREIWFSGRLRSASGKLFDGIFNALFQTIFNKIRQEF